MSKSRRPPHLDQAALRAFRHKVSALKKKGGVSKRVDARKQRATRYMLDKVKRLEPVLQGRAELVSRKSLRPDILADYERTHGRVGGKVLIRKNEGERLRVRQGMPELERTIAETKERRVVQRRIPLPVDINNFDEFINDLNTHPERWAAARGDYPPWLFGYTLNNGRSHQLFVEPQALAAALNEYRKFEDPEWFEDSWDEFILYAVDQDRIGPWSTRGTRSNRNRRRSRRSQPMAGYRLRDAAVKKAEARKRLSETKLEEIRRKDRERRAAKRQDATYRELERSRDAASKSALRRAAGVKAVPARGRRKPK